MFQPIFARGPWPETFKVSFSRTNQMANKRIRQKKGVKIFLNFTYLHKTQPGQKTAGNFPNFFEDICLPDVWVSRFGCRLEYLTLSWRYDLSKTDEALNLKQQKFWARDNGNNNSHCCKNDPRTPTIYVFNCSCHCPSTTVSLVQDSMPLRFLCELIRLVLTFQVIWQYSWEISVLYHCEISYKIERRFYQEVLSPDLKLRKQASKRFCGFRRLESLYLHESVRYFNRHPNLDTQTSGKQISLKKFGKFPAVFCPGCVL